MANWCAEDISISKKKCHFPPLAERLDSMQHHALFSLSIFVFMFTFFFIYIVFNPQGQYFTGFLSEI